MLEICLGGILILYFKNFMHSCVRSALAESWIVQSHSRPYARSTDEMPYGFLLLTKQKGPVEPNSMLL